MCGRATRSGRVELRAADSACNPYLGFALCIAAGLEGIEQGLAPPPPNTGNLFARMDGAWKQQPPLRAQQRTPTAR
eukprot:COSAG01_NODE_5639_length_4125_cov_16.441288_4_plen_76_part_00